MRNKALYMAAGLLGMMGLVMLLGAASGKAEDSGVAEPYDANSFVDYFCFDGKLGEMDVGDVIKEYKKQTNDFFNQKIAATMSNPQEEVPTPDLGKYKAMGNALCTSSGAGDLTCQSIAICNSTRTDAKISPANHPYCLGVTLLGVPPFKYDHYDYSKLKALPQLKYSYFCFKAALDRKRDDIYDSTPLGILAKCDNGSEYADNDICQLKSKLDSEKDPNKKAKIQDDLNYQINQRRWWSTSYLGAVSSLTGNLLDLTDSTASKIKSIDAEIIKAKTALDQTLDAYSQLRTSWQMHVRYIDIFNELVKYRDHLVEVRKQTDAFSLKFIDATTTKCL